ncbi:MAG TPA: hypothetical protein VGM41_08590, partial [Chitinophagaceae bacterium]
LVKEKIILLSYQSYTLTPRAAPFFAGLGIDTTALQQQRRAFARRCLDWSERKFHLSGALGAALLGQMLERDWLRKTQHSRAIVITSKGRKALAERFNIETAG